MILHICNDFSLTKVHSNLYKSIDELNIPQIIFNPVREATPIGNNNRGSFIKITLWQKRY